jgi:hypothetical protein
MRGSGYGIHENTALYSPNSVEHLFGDRDYLIFDSDFEKCDCAYSSEMFEPAPEPLDEDDDWPFPGGVVAPNEDEPPGMTLERWMAYCRAAPEAASQHSNCYYDCDRNK